MQSKACWLRMIVALLFVVQYVVAATSELNAYMLRLCDTRISPEVVANLQTKYKIQLDHFVQHDSFFLVCFFIFLIALDCQYEYHCKIETR